MHAVLPGVIPNQTQECVIKEPNDEGGGSSKNNTQVPVAKFGTFVYTHHAHGDREFKRKFEVKKTNMTVTTLCHL